MNVMVLQTCSALSVAHVHADASKRVASPAACCECLESLILGSPVMNVVTLEMLLVTWLWYEEI